MTENDNNQDLQKQDRPFTFHLGTNCNHCEQCIGYDNKPFNESAIPATFPNAEQEDPDSYAANVHNHCGCSLEADEEAEQLGEYNAYWSKQEGGTRHGYVVWRFRNWCR